MTLRVRVHGYERVVPVAAVARVAVERWLRQGRPLVAAHRQRQCDRLLLSGRGGPLRPWAMRRVARHSMAG